MANNNNGSTPTQEAIKKYKYDLCKEKVACSSEGQAKQVDFDSKKEIEQFKICELVKAEDTKEIYQNLNYTIGIGVAKEAELVGQALGTIDEQNKSLVKELQEAVKMMKDAKDKMSVALEVVCKMDRCVEEEERCNIDIYNELDGLPGFWKQLDEVMNDTNSAYDKVNTAFNGAVNVSGIQTFANLEGLKEFNDNMAAAITKFTEDVKVNIDSSTVKVQESSESLSLVLQEVSLVRHELSVASASCEGKTEAYDFLCDLPCGDPKDAIEDIRQACGKIGNPNLPSDMGVAECEEDDGDNRGGSRQRKSR